MIDNTLSQIRFSHCSVVLPAPGFMEQPTGCFEQVAKPALLLAMLGAEAVGGRAASVTLAGGHQISQVNCTLHEMQFSLGTRVIQNRRSFA